MKSSVVIVFEPETVHPSLSVTVTLIVPAPTLEDASVDPSDQA